MLGLMGGLILRGMNGNTIADFPWGSEGPNAACAEDDSEPSRLLARAASAA